MLIIGQERVLNKYEELLVWSVCGGVVIWSQSDPQGSSDQEWLPVFQTV